MSRRILLVTGDASESYETLYAVRRFREAGATVAIGAPSRRCLHPAMRDFETEGQMQGDATQAMW